MKNFKTKNGFFTGDVGIGTTSPNATLSIVDSTIDNNSIPLVLSTADSSVSENQECSIGFGQLDIAFAKISSYYAGSTGNGGFGLKMYTGGNVGSGNDRTQANPSLTIDQDGNVGIGTTSPGANLEVSNDSDKNCSIRLRNNSFNGTSLGSLIELKSIGTSQTFGTDFTITNRDLSGAFQERFRIDADGKVGIGTPNPGAKLDIQTTGGSAWGLKVRTDSADADSIKLVGGGGDTDVKLVVKGSGNVGIGTTSPIHALDVFGFGKKLGITSEHADGSRIDHATLQTDLSGFGNMTLSNNVGNSRVQFKSNGVSYINGGNVGIGTTNPIGPLHVQSALSNTINLTRSINISGIAGGASSKIQGGALSGATPSMGSAIGFALLDSDGDGSGSNTEGYMYFETKVPGASLTEKMRITSTGNVGIGTTNPGASLDIKGPGTVGTFFAAMTDGVAGVNFERVNQNTSPYNHFIFHNGNVGIGTANPDGPLHVKGGISYLEGLSLSPVSGTISEINSGSSIYGLKFKRGNQDTVMIDSSGNVGIGTTNPIYKLDVRENASTWSAYIRNEHSSPYGLSIQYPTGAPSNSGNYYFQCFNGSSTKFSIASNGDVVSSTNSYSSDDRVKHNEEKIVNAVGILSKITPKKYFKTSEMYDANHDFELDADGNPVDENGKTVSHTVEAGVIAQEVLGVDELKFTVSPESKDEDGNVTGPHSLNYNSLFTYAIAAIQEQQQTIEDLESKSENQNSIIDDLVSRIKILENK